MKKLILICIIIIITAPAVFSHTALTGGIKLTEKEQEWLDKGYTVRVRVANWPPFQIHDGSELKGISVDYIKHICEMNHIKYELVSSKDIPWTAALDNIRDKEKIDLLLTLKRTEERAEFMLFTDSYVNSPWVIFSRDDSVFISDLSDLNGKTVVVQDGFVMEGLLKENYPEIKLKVVTGANTTEKSLMTLSEGGADAYVGNLATGTYIIRSLNLLNLEVAAPTPFGTHDNHMGVRNDWPELVSIINKSLSLMTVNEKNAILNKYFSIKFNHGVRYSDVIFWVTLSLIVCGVVIFIFVLVNSKLIKTRDLLKESEDNYRQLFEHMFDGFSLLEIESAGDGASSDYAYSMVNMSFEKQTGLKREDIIGKYIGDVQPYLVRHINYNIDEILSANQTVRFEEYAQELDKYFGYFMFSPKKGYIGIISKDISLKVRYEKERKDRQERILQAEKMRAVSQLSAGLAHDLNNKICGIIGGADVLNKELCEGSQKKSLSVIVKSAKSAVEVIQKLLTFAQQDFTPYTRFNLVTLVHESIVVLRDKVKPSITITEECSSDQTFIHADKSQIFSMLVIIGTNAIEAIHEYGEVKIKVSSYICSDPLESADSKLERFCKIEFVDNGEGIPESNIDKVFEPFFSTKGFGRGLGLSSAFGTVSQHNGDISITSDLNQGTIVTVILPCT